MNAVQPEQPQPAFVPSNLPTQPTSFETEKNGATDFQTRNTSTDDGNESDGSDEFQNGVQRVRAITAVWSKTTLISMFCL